MSSIKYSRTNLRRAVQSSQVNKMTSQSSQPFEFPANFFRREDGSSDRYFYENPRFVTHIDDGTIEALTTFYEEVIPENGKILDLMSSWISHLPRNRKYDEVYGLGMNQEELENNPDLTETLVHDLNSTPTTPLPSDFFDIALCAVSVQYLTQPVEVFREVARTLKSGGVFIVSFSHRMFPTKAVEVWKSLATEDRTQLVGAYFQISELFDEPTLVKREPTEADPLWIVFATKK